MKLECKVCTHKDKGIHEQPCYGCFVNLVDTFVFNPTQDNKAAIQDKINLVDTQIYNLQREREILSALLKPKM